MITIAFRNKFLIYIGALVFLAVIACAKSEDDYSAKAKTDRQQVDRLLKDMGILKTPFPAAPVDISLQNINGRTIRLSDFRGKVVFLNFWTTWCAECRVEMPAMEALHQKFKDKNFAMVSINLQEPAWLVKEFFQNKKLTFTALLDSSGDVGKQFGLRGIPATFIFDQEGKIIGKALGSRKWNSKKSIALFEHLINKSIRNENVKKNQQKYNISYHSIKPDTGNSNPVVNSANASGNAYPYDFS